MVGMMAHAEGQNQQRKRLYVDGLQGERRRRHSGYVMVEQLDLDQDEALKECFLEVVRTVVEEFKLKRV